jgi:hypothetical protein
MGVGVSRGHTPDGASGLPRWCGSHGQATGHRTCLVAFFAAMMRLMLRQQENVTAAITLPSGS